MNCALSCTGHSDNRSCAGRELELPRVRGGQRCFSSPGVNGLDAIDVVWLKRIEVARATVHDGSHGLTVIVRVGEAEHMPELVKCYTSHVVLHTSVRRGTQ